MASSKSYEIAFKLAARMDKSYGGVFKAAEQIASNTVGKLIKTAAAIGGTVLSFNAVNDAIDKAKDFESSMADVAKVVDGLKDTTGKTTEEYAKMSNEILNMTSRLPMAAKDITDIIAAAGQSGIAANELTRFAEDAAKMGVAFDLPAKDAGEMAAVIRSSLGLSQDAFVELADKINYFGNTTTQNAGKLIQVVQDAGLIGKQAGVTADQIAAMGAAMTGMDAANMSTALSNIYGSLMTGAGATTAAASAWESLGFTSEQVAKSMLADSEGTMLKVFEAMKKLPKEQLSSTTAAIFGNNKSTKMAIASFTENLDALKQNFIDIGDSTKYAGSMQAEFDSRAATTENKVQLMNNAVDRMKITLGNLFLPAVSSGAVFLADSIGKITDKIPDAINSLKGFGKGIADKLGLSDVFNNIEINGGAIQKNAEYFVNQMQLGIKQFMTGGSLAAAMEGPLRAAGNILKGIFGEDMGGNMVSGIESAIGKISPIVDTARVMFQTLIDKVQDLQPAFEGVQRIFGGVWDIVSRLTDKITGMFSGGEGAAEGFSSVVGAVIDVINNVISAIEDVLSSVSSRIDNLQPAFDSIKQIFESLWDIISQIADEISKISGSFGDGAGAADAFGIALDAAVSAITVLLDAVAKIAGFFADNWSTIEPIILGIAGAFIAFNIATTVVGAFTAVMTAVTAVTAAFGAVLAFVTSPIFLIALAIGIVIAITILLIKNWDKVKEVALKVWSSITEAISAAWENITGFFGGIGAWFSDRWNDITRNVSGAWDSVKQGASDAWDAITGFFGGIGAWFSDRWNDITRNVSGA